MSKYRTEYTPVVRPKPWLLTPPMRPKRLIALRGHINYHYPTAEVAVCVTGALPSLRITFRAERERDECERRVREWMEDNP